MYEVPLSFINTNFFFSGRTTTVLPSLHQWPAELKKKVLFCFVVKGVTLPTTLVVRPLKKNTFFMCVFPYRNYKQSFVIREMYCPTRPTCRIRGRGRSRTPRPSLCDQPGGCNCQNSKSWKPIIWDLR